MNSNLVPDAAAPDATAGAHPPKLLDRLRTRHYSIRTEEVYVDWARRFILFHDKRHPQDMAAPEVARPPKRAMTAWVVHGFIPERQRQPWRLVIGELLRRLESKSRCSRQEVKETSFA